MFNHQISRVTYPKMERQDLTQAQLGAFKFTPTDEVCPVFTDTSPIWGLVHKTNSAAWQSACHKGNSALHNGNRRESDRSSHPSPNSPTRSDHVFFDQQIKPDLENSRLRLGPNAVRAAVDGMTSPTRKDQQRNHEVSRRANTQNKLHTNQDPSSGSDRHETLYTLDPSGPAFPAKPSQPFEDNNALYTSLLRALASEQQAHEATKVALEAEISARLKADAEAGTMRDHVRSLIGSVNMLKSIVQHNVKRDLERVEEAECQRFHQAVRDSTPEPTILHDAVQNLRKPQKLDRRIQQSDETDRSFDLNIPDTPEYATLRKHFSDLTEPVSDTPVDGTDDSQLIQITPEKPKDRDTSEETWETNLAISSDSPTETDSSNGNGFVVLKTKSDLKPIPLTGPYDIPIRWTGEPMFDDEQDKIDRIGLHAYRIVPEFSTHPVRYLPQKSDKNLYRTVMIDFLPLETTYKDVLQTIHGGAVESIQLHDPIGASTTFSTARLVFNYELGARGVYMQGQSPGITIRGKRIRVWHVLEPTYPRSKKIEQTIFEENFTRLLLIDNAPKEALDKLSIKLAYQMRAGFIVEITRSHDEIPMVEFTSVAECSKALDLLINDPEFGGSRFDFEEDPCNDPY